MSNIVYRREIICKCPHGFDLIADTEFDHNFCSCDITTTYELDCPECNKVMTHSCEYEHVGFKHVPRPEPITAIASVGNYKTIDGTIHAFCSCYNCGFKRRVF